MVTAVDLRKLKGRMAEAGVTHRSVASVIGMSESAFSYVLHGRRPMPEDFEERVITALARLEAAEAAAQEAWDKVMAEDALS